MDESISSLDFYKELGSFINLENIDVRTYSPLNFAFIGDAVFSMIIRSYIVANGNTKANMLHNKTSKYVKAESQAKMSEYIADMLTEEEADIYKRGRNTHINGHTRSASTHDYKCATGLEALFGYLFLTGRNERMMELAKACVDCIEKN